MSRKDALLLAISFAVLLIGIVSFIKIQSFLSGEVSVRLDFMDATSASSTQGSITGIRMRQFNSETVIYNIDFSKTPKAEIQENGIRIASFIKEKNGVFAQLFNSTGDKINSSTVPGDFFGWYRYPRDMWIPGFSSIASPSAELSLDFLPLDSTQSSIFIATVKRFPNRIPQNALRIGDYQFFDWNVKIINSQGESLPFQESVIQSTALKSPVNEYESWNSYRNTKYNYTLKYPQNFSPRQGTFREDDLAQQSGIYFDSAFPRKSEWDIGEVSIQAEPAGAQGALKCSTDNECIEKWRKNITEKNVKSISQSINGKEMKGLQFTIYSKDFQQRISVFTFLLKGRPFLVSLNEISPNGEYNKRREYEMRAIISSLKF